MNWTVEGNTVRGTGSKGSYEIRMVGTVPVSVFFRACGLLSWASLYRAGQYRTLAAAKRAIRDYDSK